MLATTPNVPWLEHCIVQEAYSYCMQLSITFNWIVQPIRFHLHLYGNNETPLTEKHFNKLSEKYIPEHTVFSKQGSWSGESKRHCSRRIDCGIAKRSAFFLLRLCYYWKNFVLRGRVMKVMKPIMYVDPRIILEVWMMNTSCRSSRWTWCYNIGCIISLVFLHICLLKLDSIYNPHWSDDVPRSPRKYP